MKQNFIGAVCDFLELIYPKVCLVCGSSLYRQEDLVCTPCLFHLPRTDWHHDEYNPVSKLFWGRVNIFSATAYYYFNKGSKVQRLLHQLKYKGYKDLGFLVHRSLTVR